MSIFRTPTARAALHSSGWIPFRGKWITARPLIDLDHKGLYARLVYRDALEVARRLGGRLMTKAEIDEVWKHGHRTKAIIMTPGPMMASLEYATVNDNRLNEQLEQTGFDGSKPVAGPKMWAADAPEGRSFNYGLFRPDGSPWQPLSAAHNDQHTDYSQLTMLIRDTEPATSSGSGVWGKLVEVGRELLRAMVSDGEGDPFDPRPTRVTFPHGYRCAVSELCADGIALGTLVLAAAVRAGRYTPKVGDLVISARLGENPLQGGHGHVERIVSIADGSVVTVGGNEANGWNVAAYDFADPNFVAVIDVPAELGARAVHVALAEKAAGVREKPGAAHHPRIQHYHAGARRKGSPLAGMPGHERDGTIVLGSAAADEIAWCASSASFCAYQAALAIEAAA